MTFLEIITFKTSSKYDFDVLILEANMLRQVLANEGSSLQVSFQFR